MNAFPYFSLLQNRIVQDSLGRPRGAGVTLCLNNLIFFVDVKEFPPFFPKKSTTLNVYITISTNRDLATTFLRCISDTSFSFNSESGTYGFFFFVRPPELVFRWICSRVLVGKQLRSCWFRNERLPDPHLVLGIKNIGTRGSHN